MLRVSVACVTGVYKGRRLREREKGSGIGDHSLVTLMFMSSSRDNFTVL